jgi:hypothetical protein
MYTVHGTVTMGHFMGCRRCGCINSSRRKSCTLCTEAFDGAEPKRQSFQHTKHEPALLGLSPLTLFVSKPTTSVHQADKHAHRVARRRQEDADSVASTSSNVSSASDQMQPPGVTAGTRPLHSIDSIARDCSLPHETESRAASDNCAPAHSQHSSVAEDLLALHLVSIVKRPVRALKTGVVRRPQTYTDTHSTGSTVVTASDKLETTVPVAGTTTAMLDCAPLTITPDTPTLQALVENGAAPNICHAACGVLFAALLEVHSQHSRHQKKSSDAHAESSWNLGGVVEAEKSRCQQIVSSDVDSLILRPFRVVG